jgi:hypothetical protein
VQSRRVSLRLGPLDLTYATDELLWAPSGPSGPSDLTRSSGTTGDSAEAGSASVDSASTATWTDAGAPDFASDLDAATRLEEAFRRAAQAAADAQTYGPARAARQAAQTTAQTTTQASGQNTSQTAGSGAMRRAIAAYRLQAAQAAAGMFRSVA